MSTDNDSTPKKKTKRRENRFKKTWTEEYKFIKSFRKGELYAFCEVCRTDIGISHGGLCDVNKHISTEKNVSNAKAITISNSSSMNLFRDDSSSSSSNDIRAEVLFEGFLIEHNLQHAVNDHFSKLARLTFPDSEIAR